MKIIVALILASLALLPCGVSDEDDMSKDIIEGEIVQTEEIIGDFNKDIQPPW